MKLIFSQYATLTVLLICNNQALAGESQQLDGSLSGMLRSLERRAGLAPQNSETELQRLANIEKKIFGSTQAGTANERLRKITVYFARSIPSVKQLDSAQSNVATVRAGIKPVALGSVASPRNGPMTKGDARRLRVVDHIPVDKLTASEAQQGATSCALPPPPGSEQLIAPGDSVCPIEPPDDIPQKQKVGRNNQGGSACAIPRSSGNGVSHYATPPRATTVSQGNSNCVPPWGRATNSGAGNPITSAGPQPSQLVSSHTPMKPASYVNSVEFLKEGASIVIRSNSTVKTYDCTKANVLLNASNCQIKFRGSYCSVVITGNNNRVQVSSPGSIQVTGDDNRIYWTGEKCIPKISGINNSVKHVQENL